MTPKDKVGVFAFGFISLTTFGLGSWQVKRYSWKVDMVEQRKRMLVTPPVPVDAARGEIYERVKCLGDFEPEKSMTISPRSSPLAAVSSAPSPSGFYLLTPFKDQLSNRRFLVVRGWLPRSQEPFYRKGFGEIHDKNVELEGFIAPDETAGLFTPDNNANTGNYFYMDAKVMNEANDIGADQLIVEQLGGFKEGPVTKTTDSLMTFKVHPATHVGYAATWYGLSAAGLYMIKRRFF